MTRFWRGICASTLRLIASEEPEVDPERSQFGALVLLAHAYHPVADGDYLDDPRVGAMMGQDAIRKGLDLALLDKVGIFHVHEHGHKGRPRFSKVDLTEQMKFVPDFFKVRPEMPHGAIVLSHDHAAGRVWLAPHTVEEIREFNVVGPRTLFDRIKAAVGINITV